MECKAIFIFVVQLLQQPENKTSSNSEKNRIAIIHRQNNDMSLCKPSKELKRSSYGQCYIKYILDDGNHRKMRPFQKRKIHYSDTLFHAYIQHQNDVQHSVETLLMQQYFSTIYFLLVIVTSM